MDMFILPFMSSHQVLFQLLWYVTTRSNSKFAIAWVESSHRCCRTSIFTGSIEYFIGWRTSPLG